MFPFLRTYKPMLKRARQCGTREYGDVRRLLKQWLYCQHMVRLLHQQNARLYQAAMERDSLLWEKHHNVEGHTGDTSVDGDSIVFSTPISSPR